MILGGIRRFSSVSILLVTGVEKWDLEVLQKLTTLSLGWLLDAEWFKLLPQFKLLPIEKLILEGNLEVLPSQAFAELDNALHYPGFPSLQEIRVVNTGKWRLEDVDRTLARSLPALETRSIPYKAFAS